MISPLTLRSACAWSLAAVLSIASGSGHAVQAYLEDAVQDAPSTNVGPSLNRHLYPRVMTHEMQRTVTNAAYSKYHIIYVQGENMRRLAVIQRSNPDVMFIRHISGRAYQSYDTEYCRISMGMAFEESGPRTQGGPQADGCSIYAGHWLYKAGTTLTAPINASKVTLRVANAQRLKVGRYVVIYDAPAGSFKNAEHARVIARNVAENTVTLAARGYKSVARSHAAGAIVAEHVLGQGTEPRLWAFNFSTKAPRDADGKTLADAYVDWLQRNLNRYHNGADPGANVSGILFDADFNFDFKDTDANNDLVTDDGMSRQGVNWHGIGLDQFYAQLRAALPNKIILGGTSEARGFDSLQGLQMENFPDFGNGDFNADVEYRNLNSQIADYRFQMHSRAIGFPHSANLTKVPTAFYPGSARPIPTSNAPARFSLGLTLLDGGHHGTHAGLVSDAWWDEYAVDVTPGAPTYGHAIPKDQVGNARRHRGWLGRPLGSYRRLYNDGQFAPHRALFKGDFENQLLGWKADNVTIGIVNGQTMDGAGALRISSQLRYSSRISGAAVSGPKRRLTKGTEYTLVFSARGQSAREIRVSAGGNRERFLIDPRWRRYVMSFRAKTSGDQAVSFDVGREDSVVWLDSVYLFAGNANLFRRDFDNGIVVVNGTHRTRTIDLEGTFKLIQGTQDPVNSGEEVGSVTLAPFDARLLVKLDPESDDDGSATGSLDVCGRPDLYERGAVQGIFVWKECNNGESWQVRVSSGAARNIRFDGSLVSDRPIVGVNGRWSESGDSLDLDQAGRRLNYRLLVWLPRSFDGFEFQLGGSASRACFRAVNNIPVYLGKSSAAVSAPIDLLKGGAPCS